MSGYTPILQALVDVLTADDNMDATVVNAALTLSAASRSRLGASNIAHALSSSAQSAMKHLTDECRENAQLSLTRRVLARRYCVSLLANLCESYSCGDANTRSLFDTWKGCVEDVLAEAQSNGSCSDARTREEAERGARAVKGGIPALVPLSLAPTHIVVQDQTTSQLRASIENALAPHNIPHSYDPAKFKFKCRSWTPQGYAKFVIHMYRPTDATASGCVVEMMRRSGSGFIASRLFRDISGAIANQATSANGSPILRKPTRPSPTLAPACADVEVPDLGSLVSQLAGPNVDEVLSAGLTVCSILGHAPRTSKLAADAALVEGLMALLNPVTPVNMDCRTAAAQALSQVVSMDSGATTISGVARRKPLFVDWILAGLFEKDSSDIDNQHYQRFLCVFLA